MSITQLEEPYPVLYPTNRYVLNLTEYESDSSDDDFDEDVLLILLRKRKRRCWSSNFLMKRSKYGEFHCLLPDLTDKEFFRYMRLTKEQFEEVHNLIEKDLGGGNKSYFRPAISTKEKLAVCLR